MSDENALSRFLQKNTIQRSIDMPVFHSTSAYSAKNIIIDGVIEPKSCTVFNSEKLSYLFYGRPSYKREGKSKISKYWQLPAVFIFDHQVVDYKRVFPFDTGAFANNLYPDFFGMMPRDEFEVSAIQDAPNRLISSFFVDAERYFRLKPRDKRDFDTRYQTTAVDEEIHALYELILSYSEKVDDRRFSIEIQTEKEIDLKSGKCLAIIIPEEYLESEKIIDISEELKIEILSYPSFPLKQEMYYYHIYTLIYEIYKDWGVAR